MRVLIISPFFSIDLEQSRPAFVRSVLSNHESIEVMTLTSDFCHQTKSKKSYSVGERIEVVRTLSYSRNTSIIRFISHLLLSFSLFFKAFSYRKSVDVYYITAPFSLVILFAKLFTNKKVVADIVDFWPDSLPFKKNKVMSFALYFWRKINHFAINKADRITSLSTSFLDAVGEPHGSQILLGSRSEFVTAYPKDASSLKILYLGNIGVLYDFDTLIKAAYLLKEQGINVAFEIVGTGDKKNWLLEELDSNSLSYNYHGVVFDSVRLKEIISKCHVGFNGYNSTTASFSYKAASYLKFGLPIINSMDGDLHNFVEQFDIGVNYQSNNVGSLMAALVEATSIEFNKQANVIKFFNGNLEYTKVSNKIVRLFEELFHEKTV
ncbi:glycosyltransferase [Vibrio alfacsensis]|uniref:glycosyltransferase n=1 Tax=Vibrio alfacsensis TaxID=1074311 RepID=UPI00406818AE